MLNKLSQKEFFLEVTSQKVATNSATTLYAELIENRFLNTIKSTNPIFSRLVGEDDLKNCVSDFIKLGYARSRFVWQIPNEFRRFVKKEKKFKHLKFLDDLLWFEFSGIELFMKDYTGFKFTKFSWNKSLKLSKNSVVKALNYKVHLKEFDNRQKSYLLGYYDLLENKVVYIEISNFMYDFLKLIKTCSLKQAFDVLSKEYEIDKRAMKNDMQIALRDLCKKGVLIV